MFPDGFSHGLAGEPLTGLVEHPAALARRCEIALPVPGLSAVATLDPERPVDGADAALADRDRRRDPAVDLGLPRPRLGRELDRRVVAVAALVLVGVGEEDRVVAGDVEVVEAREHVAALADHEDVRTARREVDRAEAAVVGPAHLVAVVAGQPRIPEVETATAAPQPPDVGDLELADPVVIAGRVGPGLVFGRRDDRPRPGFRVGGKREAVSRSRKSGPIAS